MKKLTILLFSVVLVLSQVGMAKSEVILFEDFEDSSNLILAGCVPAYWDIAPLEGTASIPSQFQQGSSSQDGNIFYGSLAKENSLSPTATMTIVLPDLSGYTNLELNVALAAAEGIWEPTHRDSLHIIGETTISPPYVDCTLGPGCQPVTGAIDSFLPITYPDNLRSNVHSIDLDHQFQDFTYPIDKTMKSLTFAFASTAAVEVVGIDSVKITGDPITQPCTIDIYPDTLNKKSKGKYITIYIELPETYSVEDIDIETVMLSVNGFSIPAELSPTEIGDYNDNNIPDFMVKFDRQLVQDACGTGAVAMTLNCQTYDETNFEGSDTVLAIDKGQEHCREDHGSVVY